MLLFFEKESFYPIEVLWAMGLERLYEWLFLYGYMDGVYIENPYELGLKCIRKNFQNCIPKISSDNVLFGSEFVI